MKHYALSLLAIIAIYGCSSSTETPATTTGSAPATTTAATTGTTTGGTPAAPKASDIPAELKNDAFSYYGLGNEQVMNVEMKVTGKPTKTGGMMSKLEKVENGTATFSVERTGGIAEDLGTDTISVEKDGIYQIGTSMGTMTPNRSLQLPADLTPGKSWNTKTTVVRSDGTEISEDSTYTVKGIEKVTTAVGTYDALVVTSKGTGSVKMAGNTQPAIVSATSYYVKDRGLVKQVVSLALGKAPASSVTIEESK